MRRAPPRWRLAATPDQSGDLRRIRSPCGGSMRPPQGDSRLRVFRLALRLVEVLFVHRAGVLGRFDVMATFATWTTIDPISFRGRSTPCNRSPIRYGVRRCELSARSYRRIRAPRLARWGGRITISESLTIGDPMRTSTALVVAAVTMALAACDRPHDNQAPSVAPEAIKG